MVRFMSRFITEKSYFFIFYIFKLLVKRIIKNPFFFYAYIKIIYAHFKDHKLWKKLHCFSYNAENLHFLWNFHKASREIYIRISDSTDVIASGIRFFARDFLGQDARTSPKDPKIRAGRVLIRTWWLTTAAARVRMAACRRERFRRLGDRFLVETDASVGPPWQ